MGYSIHFRENIIYENWHKIAQEKKELRIVAPFDRENNFICSRDISFSKQIKIRYT